MKRRILTAIVVLLSAPALWAQMQLLRPIPDSIAAADKSELSAERSRLIEEASTLCSTYANLKSRCETTTEAGSTLPADCAQSLADFRTSLSSHNAAATQYNDAVVAALRQRIKVLSAAVRQDQQAIRNLGIHRDAAEFDAWSLWLTAADEERQRQAEEAFREAAKDAVMSKIEQAFRIGVDKAAALDPQSAQNLIDRLRGAGVGDPYFLEAIEKFGAVTNKQEKAKAGMELLEQLKKAKTIWDLHDLGPDQESATWKVGAALLELFIPDPELQLIGKLTLDEVRATFYTVNEAAFDFPVFLSQINRLQQLTDQHLNILRMLSARLQADVQEKVRTAKDLATIDQQPADGGC